MTPEEAKALIAKFMKFGPRSDDLYPNKPPRPSDVPMRYVGTDVGHLSGGTNIQSLPRKFEPSSQQQTIFDELAKGLEFCDMPFFNIIVDAKAGSGKTTTIVEGMRYIPREPNLLTPPLVVFLAFNKSIADTLGRKCPPGVICSTFHSLGFRALKSSGLVKPSVKVDSRKCMKLVWNAINDRDDPDTRNICKLVSLAKSVPCDVSEIDFDETCYHHDIILERAERAYNIVRAVVEVSLRDTDVIDFDDMLYMPVMFNISFQHYHYVFVDEAQDTNSLQLEIVSRLLGPRSRLIAVGDPHQAIYGFRGANADSMSRITQRFQCKTFPLSVSYRCPKAVVREAQRYLEPTKHMPTKPEDEGTPVNLDEIEPDSLGAPETGEDEPECPDSPSGQHEFDTNDEGETKCVYCDEEK